MRHHEPQDGIATLPVRQTWRHKCTRKVLCLHPEAGSQAHVCLNKPLLMNGAT